MGNQQRMRASDRDRQQAVERLRSALEDGRLTVEEYVDRMGVAYQAVTYGDLAPLSADLPASSPVIARPETAARASAPPAVFSGVGFLVGLPAVLKVLWTIWLAAVSINVVVWALVSSTGGHLAYPWPSRLPVRTGQRCSPCRLMSRCSGAAGRPSRARGRCVADQIKLADAGRLELVRLVGGEAVSSGDRVPRLANACLRAVASPYRT